MRKNLKYKILGGLIPAFLIGCNSGTQDPNQIKLGNKTVNSEQLTATNHGEIIYLYKSVDDKIPQRMLTNLDKTDLNNILSDDNSEKLHIRTYVMVKDTTDYQFLPEISNAQIFINSKRISGKINLLANNLYALDIIIKKSNSKSKLDLSWIKTASANSKSEKIPLANLYLPTENIFAPSLTKGVHPSIKLDDLTDTSGNGIPDDWSINGYTSVIKNGKIIIEKWDDKIHVPMKKTKFYSSPLKWSTAGDPYSDYQKVTGIGLDNSIAKEARNPLVAAYPEISVELDGMVISKNQKVTDTTNGSTTNTITVTKSTAELTQNSHKVGASLGGEWGKPKFIGMILSAIKPTASYEYNKVTSTTVTDSKSDAEAIMEGWINAIEINDAQAAYLTPLVHYYNRGTASAYNVKPKYNLAYKDLNDQIVSLKTIEAQMAEQANLIAPNLSYPKSAQDSLVVASNNMSLITINKKQLETLEKTKEVFLNNLEATSSLSLKLGNNDAKLVDWAPYLNDINHSSALIELAAPDGSMLSRRAVARPINENGDLIQSSNPELSLNEALKLSYDFDITESKMENSDYIYYGFIFNITGRKNIDEINKQLKENGNNLGNVKLKIGMIFTIIPDGLVYDKNTDKYYYYENGVGTLLNKNANIPSDKYYYIRNYKEDLYFNVWQASYADYASIVAHPMQAKASNKQFRLIKNKEGAYNIIARHSEKGLHIEANSASDGANLIQHKSTPIPNTAGNQSFDILYGKGKIIFKNKNSGKCLQNTGDRSNIKQFTCSNTNSQLWELVEVEKLVLDESKNYYIKNYNQELYFDVWNVSTADYAAVKGQYKGSLLQGNQHFKLVKNSQDDYNIIARHSGKALLIKNNDNNDNTDLIQHRTGAIPLTQPNASFDVFYEKGKLKFKAKNSGKCLQSTGLRSEIKQFTCNNADSQLWELVDVEQSSVPASFTKTNVWLENVYSGLVVGTITNNSKPVAQLGAFIYQVDTFSKPARKVNITYSGYNAQNGTPLFKIVITNNPKLAFNLSPYDLAIDLANYSQATKEHNWFIYDNGDGTYSFMNAAAPHKLLDLESCRNIGFIPFQLQPHDFNCSNGDSRKWRIVQG